MSYEILRISEHKELIGDASEWFGGKWSIPREAYAESMECSLTAGNGVPSWYVCTDGGRIIAGLGVIENDFHERKDLSPNVCAVFTEPEYRNRRIAGKLLNFVTGDMIKHGFDTLYLVTDHDSFYERYGWKYLCPVLCDGERTPSRMYIHKPVIITERLYLREMNDADFDSLYAVLSDSDIMRHYPYTFDEARVRRWINKNKERYNDLGFGLWAVCLRDTGEMIGDCGLTMQNINGTVCPEIGYHIRGDRQRMGYAGEASKAVRDWTFENTRFSTVYSYMKSDNVASVATAKSYGARKISEFTDDEGELTSVFALSK